MESIQIKDITLYKFKIFEQYHEIRHFVTGRNGGFSKGTTKGLNLGFGTDDNADTVTKNRYALSESLGIPLDWFVFMQQTHSANIASINSGAMSHGAYSRDNAVADTDALITSTKNICIVVQVADCVPLLILDPISGVIAAIHAGWRGTFLEITRQTIEKMILEYETNPAEIIACIGPSIGPCCYEVGDEIKQKFIAKDSSYSKTFHQKDGKIKLDLWQANKLQLIKSGLKQENIEISELCTRCNHDIFYSSRDDNGKTGRFVAGIMLV
jgi:polyphenol oxidase